MIMAWLLKSTFGVPRWLLVGGVILLTLIVALVYLKRAENLDDAQNQEIGAAVEREKVLEETVNRVEKANDVREEISRNDDAGAQLRYDQCLRSARTPANCQRFLPGGQAD
jgi:hypothetical protein